MAAIISIRSIFFHLSLADAAFQNTTFCQRITETRLAGILDYGGIIILMNN